MFRNHVPERCPIFSHGIGLVPEQISLKNSISQCSTESVRSSYRNCNLNCTESVKPLQNPRCFPCDLHDFAFGTMVPEHSASFSFEKQGLFRNIFRFSTKTLGVPGHLLEFRAGVPAEKPVHLCALISMRKFFHTGKFPLEPWPRSPGGAILRPACELT